MLTLNLILNHPLQDVARLIVERSTIMNNLFSRHSSRPESDAVLCAFLNIFSSYIKRMRKTKEGEDLYSWVSTFAGKMFWTEKGLISVWRHSWGHVKEGNLMIKSLLDKLLFSQSLRIRCFCVGLQERLLRCTFLSSMPWLSCWLWGHPKVVLFTLQCLQC